MNKLLLNLLFVALLMIFSCTSENTYDDLAFDTELAFNEDYNGKNDDLSANSDEPIEKTNKIASERFLIKRGNIEFETDDLNTTQDFLKNVIQDLNGYIANDNIKNFDHKVEQSIVIRIPSGKFDKLLEQINTHVSDFENKNIEVLDVSEEYIDVNARIKTMTEIENRYRDLLNKAVKIDEILKVESELGRIRTRIETAEARLRYLNDRIAYSTLNVKYYEVTSTPNAYTAKFTNAFENGWELLLLFIIGMTNIWPFLLLVMVLFFTYKITSKKGK